jgi:hypothetical protein
MKERERLGEERNEEIERKMKNEIREGHKQITNKLFLYEPKPTYRLTEPVKIRHLLHMINYLSLDPP